MSVDRDEVRRIAELAKLDLDDAEADRLTGEMNRILEHAERLREVDADEGAATPGDDSRVGSDGHASGPEDAAWRADESASETVGATSEAADGVAGPDALLRPLDAFAPEMMEGFFAVPPPPGVVVDTSDAYAATEAGGSDEGRAEDDAG